MTYLSVSSSMAWEGTPPQTRLDNLPFSLHRWQVNSPTEGHRSRRLWHAMSSIDLDLLEMQPRLHQTFSTDEAINDWLDHPSPFLDRLTPREAIRAGRKDRVYAALEALDSGTFI